MEVRCLAFWVILELLSFDLGAQLVTHTIGQKSYEVTNHLLHVTIVVSDRKRNTPALGGNTVADPDVISSNDFYPYGMPVNGRTSTTVYRFGFQGQERDNEVTGGGNSIHYTYRRYDPRLGRWLSPDPLMGDFPQSSPYLMTQNSPLWQYDPDGRKAKVSITRNEEGGGTIEISTTIYVDGLKEEIADQFVSMMNAEAKELLKDGTYVDEAGQTWNIKLSINFEAGKKGDSQEDRFFNNQLTVSNTENQANVYTGEGKITSNTINKAMKGKQDKVGTIMEESIHFLGLGDQYDVVVEGLEKKRVGFLPKEGFEDDVLTGGTRKSNYVFSDLHFISFGDYFQQQGLLHRDNKTTTSLINTRISGGIEEVEKSSLSPEQQKKIIRTF